MVPSRNLVVLILLAVAVPRGGVGETRAATPDAKALAKRIDERLAARFRQEGIISAPPADDAEFLRRVYLDLTGRIPRPADVHEFLADTRPDKRSRMIDQLLEEPRFAIHQANVWRAELIPETAADRQAALLQRGFENYLLERFRAGVHYNQLARELIAVPLPPEGQAAQPALRDPERSNPLAFIVAKDAKPENLAAAVTRTFLGLRLECAECHDHPFASWSQEQFWNQAAFFGGLNKKGNGLFAPLTESPRREVEYQIEKKTYPAIWLDGNTPPWSGARSSRDYLADWIVTTENPFFAKAGANRIWGQLFGAGIVEPVDDFHDNNPPSDPELFAELAEAFAASDFDITYLIRALCQTEAYGRTSARTDPSQDATRLPARMTVKAMSGEQFFDSLALATGYRDDQDKGAARQQFVSRFARVSPLNEPETSVQQALTLLNGRFVAGVTDPKRNATLIAVIQTPGLSDEERIEALYLSTLSRNPTSSEMEKLRARGDSLNEQQYADILWILLNSAEFRLNH